MRRAPAPPGPGGDPGEEDAAGFVVGLFLELARAAARPGARWPPAAVGPALRAAEAAEVVAAGAGLRRRLRAAGAADDAGAAGDGDGRLGRQLEAAEGELRALWPDLVGEAQAGEAHEPERPGALERARALLLAAVLARPDVDLADPAMLRECLAEGGALQEEGEAEGGPSALCGLVLKRFVAGKVHALGRAVLAAEVAAQEQRRAAQAARPRLKRARVERPFGLPAVTLATAADPFLEAARRRAVAYVFRFETQCLMAAACEAELGALLKLVEDPAQAAGHSGRVYELLLLRLLGDPAAWDDAVGALLPSPRPAPRAAPSAPSPALEPLAARLCAALGAHPQKVKAVPPALLALVARYRRPVLDCCLRCFEENAPKFSEAEFKEVLGQFVLSVPSREVRDLAGEFDIEAAAPHPLPVLRPPLCRKGS